LCIGDADLHNIGNFDIELPNWAVAWIFPALHYVSTITRHYRQTVCTVEDVFCEREARPGERLV
jgi:hypothetical protein